MRQKTINWVRSVNWLGPPYPDRMQLVKRWASKSGDAWEIAYVIELGTEIWKAVESA